MKLIPTFIAVLGFIAVVPSAIAYPSEAKQLENYLTMYPKHCLRSTQAEIKECLIATGFSIPTSELNQIAWNHLVGVYGRANRNVMPSTKW